MSDLNFKAFAERKRTFKKTERRLVGQIPTIAITPVADGRTGAYESNVAGTWEMVKRDLLQKKIVRWM